MNAPVAAAQGPSLKANQALIVGRVERSTRRTGRDGAYHLTLVKIAAEDEFSSPSTVEISSTSQLGAKGEVIRQVVKVSGYPRSYESKATRDHDAETVYTADNRLQAVE